MARSKSTYPWLTEDIFQQMTKARDMTGSGAVLLEFDGKPLIRGGEVALLTAPPKRGKTLYAMSLLGSFLKGKPWLNGRFKVKAQQVLYIAPIREMPPHLVTQYAAKLGIPLGKLKRQYFSTPEGCKSPEERRDALEQACQGLYRHGVEALIIVDSLMRFIPSLPNRSAENDSGVMEQVMGHFADMARAYGHGLTILHHDNKSGASTRGSNAIDGSVDHVLTIHNDSLMYREGRVLPSKTPLGKLTLDDAKGRPNLKPQAVVRKLLGEHGRPMTIQGTGYDCVLSEAEIREHLSRAGTELPHLRKNLRSWMLDGRTTSPGKVYVLEDAGQYFAILNQ